MQSEVCLNIAADHRIRAYFESVTIKPESPSHRVSHTQRLGESLGRSSAEVQVSELAGPAVKGGIVVTLQQPRNNRSYEHGIDRVIDDCRTLHALKDVFRVVSCETLAIRTDICIIDLLPYISKDVRGVNETELKYVSRHTLQAVCGKEPNVVLCAGKLRLSEPEDSRNLKEDVKYLESIGVGRLFGWEFGHPPRISVRAKGENTLFYFARVNGFHPSFALNHHPHISLLRQLLILVCVETCDMVRGDWSDDGWKMELRSRCQKLSKSLSGTLALTFPTYALPDPL